MWLSLCSGGFEMSHICLQNVGFFFSFYCLVIIKINIPFSISYRQVPPQMLVIPSLSNSFIVQLCPLFNSA